MSVYLVQHGKAKTEEEDPQRPLNKEGEADVEKIAKHLAGLSIIVDSIRHSGKLRAEQTALILARHCSPKNGFGEMPGLDPGDNPAPIAKIIRQQHRDIMLVGHLPFMDKLCSLLVCGREDCHPVSFTQGCVIRLERNGENDSFSVAWFLTPGIL